MRFGQAARSSMWEDLQRGRPTEIDYLRLQVLTASNVSAHPLTDAQVETLRQKLNWGFDIRN